MDDGSSVVADGDAVDAVDAVDADDAGDAIDAVDAGDAGDAGDGGDALDGGDDDAWGGVDVGPLVTFQSDLAGGGQRAAHQYSRIKY